LLLTTATAQKELTNRDIWASPTFSAEYVGGLESMNDGQHYTVLDEVDGVPVIDQYAYKTGQKVITLVNGSTLIPTGGAEPVAIEGYSFSGDEKKLMIETGGEPIYRWSSKAHNYIFDRTGKTVSQVNDALRAKGIFGGKDISGEGLGLGQAALYCVTEVHEAADIRRLADALQEIVA